MRHALPEAMLARLPGFGAALVRLSFGKTGRRSVAEAAGISHPQAFLGQDLPGQFYCHN